MYQKKNFKEFILFSKINPSVNDDVIKSLTFLRLSDRHKATMNEMSILLKLFLRLGPKNVSDLESELLEF